MLVIGIVSSANIHDSHDGLNLLFSPPEIVMFAAASVRRSDLPESSKLVFVVHSRPSALSSTAPPSPPPSPPYRSFTSHHPTPTTPTTAFTLKRHSPRTPAYKALLTPHSPVPTPLQHPLLPPNTPTCPHCSSYHHPPVHTARILIPPADQVFGSPPASTGVSALLCAPDLAGGAYCEWVPWDARGEG